MLAWMIGPGRIHCGSDQQASAGAAETTAEQVWSVGFPAS